MIFDKVQSNPILCSPSEHFKIKPIPKTTKQIYPEITAGQYSKDDVAKLFGNISSPDTKPEKRRMIPKEILPTQLEPSRKKRKKTRHREICCKKNPLSLSTSVDIVKEYTVPSVKSSYHISLDESGEIWVSDNYGILVQTDVHGNQLQKIQTSGTDVGYHAVTQNGYLIYANREHNTINSISLDKTVAEVIGTKKWTPLRIHSSKMNGNLLVGMSKGWRG